MRLQYRTLCDVIILMWHVQLALYAPRPGLTGIGIPIINLRGCSDRRKFITGNPIPARRRLFNLHLLSMADQGLSVKRRYKCINIGISIINLRRSSDRRRFIMVISIPIRRRLLEYRGPGYFFCAWLSKVFSEMRRYKCNVFSRWPRPCSL